MSRRKRYIKGNVYYSNDSVFLKTKSKKRRVIAINNDRNHVAIKRVLSANKGRNSKKGVKIEKYPDIKKESVVENRKFKKTLKGEDLTTKKMKKNKNAFK